MKIAKTITIMLVCLAPLCSAANTEKTDSKPTAQQQTTTPANDKLAAIIKKINASTEKLKSLQAVIENKYIQDPDLFESVTINKGNIYYLKTPARSFLRIEFLTRQEDDFKPEIYCEDYIFDGIWFTRINHKLKQINMDQFAPVAKPIDVFSLISANFPLVGFTGMDKLEKDFTVKLIDAPQKGDIHMLLKVKKDSKLSKKYTQVDFYVNPKTYLPTRLVSKTPENDTYDIKITAQQINKKIAKSVFQVETPPGFDKNVTRLQDKQKEQEKETPDSQDTKG